MNEPSEDAGAAPAPAPAAAGSLRLTRWVFLRLLALVYLAAFASLAPQIAGLVGSAGVPERPPGRIRAIVYEYRFSDASTRRETGAWYVREPRGLYAPVLARD